MKRDPVFNMGYLLLLRSFLKTRQWWQLLLAGTFLCFGLQVAFLIAGQTYYLKSAFNQSPLKLELKETVTAQQAANLLNSLQQLPAVREAHFLTPQKQLQLLQQMDISAPADAVIKNSVIEAQVLPDPAGIWTIAEFLEQKQWNSMLSATYIRDVFTRYSLVFRLEEANANIIWLARVLMVIFTVLLLAAGCVYSIRRIFMNRGDIVGTFLAGLSLHWPLCLAVFMEIILNIALSFGLSLSLIVIGEKFGLLPGLGGSIFRLQMPDWHGQQLFIGLVITMAFVMIVSALSVIGTIKIILNRYLLTVK